MSTSILLVWTILSLIAMATAAGGNCTATERPAVGRGLEECCLDPRWIRFGLYREWVIPSITPMYYVRYEGFATHDETRIVVNQGPCMRGWEQTKRRWTKYKDMWHFVEECRYHFQ